MSSYLAIIGISFLFSIMFIPAYGVGTSASSATFSTLEIVNELEYYTLDDSMTVRGKTPTNESLDITLDIKHFESGDILKTFETKSTDGRYSLDFLISDIFTNDSPSGKYQVVLTYGDRTPEINSFKFDSSLKSTSSSNTVHVVKVIPDWIKFTVGVWVDGISSDDEFISAIQFLINDKIILIPPTAQGSDENSSIIPDWIKFTVGVWVDGISSDDEFISAIQFLVTNGMLKI